MKKLISALVIMFLCSMSYAESMKFITVLSSPVGTFNKLEAVDSTSSAYGKKVNFCTSIGTQGVVELKGTKSAELTTVALANNTTLGKTDEGKFSLNNITLKQGGSIKGGRLFGNTVTVNNAASGKANNLYGNQLTVAGAKTKTLDVNSGASKINGPGESTGKEEMVWSNEYQDDDACKSGSACAKQYLLKEKGNRIPETPKCTADRRTKWDGTRCVCPNDGEYWVNGFCCSVDTPKTNRQCWIPPRTAWIVPAGFDHTSVSGNANCNVSGLTICPGVQMQYNNDPNNTYWVLPSNSDIADGKTCSPTRQCIYDCVIRRKSEIVGWSYTADIKIAACAERAYTPQWDPAVHKNY
ncbi:MAG: hypothetical protein PUC11_02715 [Elusimicrobia bacterium]|nr:hypothetical protein [Elusimicrobiota bacterium]